MDQEKLAALIERPEIQQKILQNYAGDYSIGITLDPRDRTKFAIRVRIEGRGTKKIPSQINLDGELIPVVVSPNFKVPSPLKASILG